MTYDQIVFIVAFLVGVVIRLLACGIVFAGVFIMWRLVT